MGVWLFITGFAIFCFILVTLINWKEDDMKKKDEIPKDGHEVENKH